MAAYDQKIPSVNIYFSTCLISRLVFLFFGFESIYFLIRSDLEKHETRNMSDKNRRFGASCNLDNGARCTETSVFITHISCFIYFLDDFFYLNNFFLYFWLVHSLLIDSLSLLSILKIYPSFFSLYFYVFNFQNFFMNFTRKI